jgi:hypothetical protein
MLQQIHRQNQLLLHLVHEIVLEVYQIQRVDPRPRITQIILISFSYTNLLELVENL